MRISDWSSDVCSSDLATGALESDLGAVAEPRLVAGQLPGIETGQRQLQLLGQLQQTRLVLLEVDTGQGSNPRELNAVRQQRLIKHRPPCAGRAAALTAQPAHQARTGARPP